MRNFRLRLQHYFVAAMMLVVGWGLRAMSRADPVVRSEAAGFADGMLIEMKVLPDGPGMVLQKQPDGRLAYLGARPPHRPELSIRFKHLSHAFAVLSFQESTPAAFTRGRLVVDGDLAAGVRLVRCLYRLEAVLLPHVIAARGMKRYPRGLGLMEKLGLNLRVYGRMAIDLLARS